MKVELGFLMIVVMPLFHILCFLERLMIAPMTQVHLTNVAIHLHDFRSQLQLTPQ